MARIVTPFFDRLSKFFAKFLPATTIAMLDKKILNANNFYGLNSEQFLGFSFVVGFLLAVVVGDVMTLANKDTMRFVSVSLITMLMGMFIHYLFLEKNISDRRNILRRELPDVLDLLTVSVEAGLGFDSALVKLSEKMKGPMVDEFTRMLQEIRIGVARRDALRSLAARCNVQDISLFTSALIQADQLGVSVSNVLRVQSLDTREKRKQRAEEQAMKAPIKMVFPLVFFIFPTLFIVLLGPALLQIINMLGNM